VLANVGRDNLPVLSIGVGENPLDQIVAVLIASNIDQGNARTVRATLSDSVQIATQELTASNLEALLYYLRCILVHAVFRCVAKHMVNSSASVSRGTMFANMLDAPIAELAVSNNVNVCENLFNAGTLGVTVNDGTIDQPCR
jgi:hypothetical protein